MMRSLIPIPERMGRSGFNLKRFDEACFRRSVSPVMWKGGCPQEYRRRRVAFRAIPVAHKKVGRPAANFCARPILKTPSMSGNSHAASTSKEFSSAVVAKQREQQSSRRDASRSASRLPRPRKRGVDVFHACGDENMRSPQGPSFNQESWPAEGANKSMREMYLEAVVMEHERELNKRSTDSRSQEATILKQQASLQSTRAEVVRLHVSHLAEKQQLAGEIAKQRNIMSALSDDVNFLAGVVCELEQENQRLRSDKAEADVNKITYDSLSTKVYASSQTEEEELNCALVAKNCERFSVADQEMNPTLSLAPSSCRAKDVLDLNGTQNTGTLVIHQCSEKSPQVLAAVSKEWLAPSDADFKSCEASSLMIESDRKDSKEDVIVFQAMEPEDISGSIVNDPLPVNISDDRANEEVSDIQEMLSDLLQIKTKIELLRQTLYQPNGSNELNLVHGEELSRRDSGIDLVAITRETSLNKANFT